MDNELLSNSIKRICKDNNMTISQLEKELNISAGLISRWSKTSPSLDKIVDIADYFKMSIDEIIGREVKSENKNENSVITFINTLYNKTQSNELSWYIYDKNHPLQYKIYTSFESYDGWNKEYYYTKYKDSYFILYVMYLEDKYEITDTKICLYIQPGEEEKPSLQWEGELELRDLWDCLRTQFYGTLYETKANLIRESFVIEENSHIYNPFNLEINELLNNSSFRDLLRIINTPEFKQFQKLYNNPEFIKTLNTVTRLTSYIESANFVSDKEVNIPDISKDTGSYLYDDFGKVIYQCKYTGITNKGKAFYKKYKNELGDIQYAQMYNGKVLIFKSKLGKVMKLSGLTSGSKSGGTGLNGALDTLREAGFNVDYAFLINHENFKISKDFKIEE